MITGYVKLMRNSGRAQRRQALSREERDRHSGISQGIAVVRQFWISADAAKKPQNYYSHKLTNTCVNATAGGYKWLGAVQWGEIEHHQYPEICLVLCTAHMPTYPHRLQGETNRQLTVRLFSWSYAHKKPGSARLSICISLTAEWQVRVRLSSAPVSVRIYIFPRATIQLSQLDTGNPRIK